ncbi:MAG: GTP-binding protein [Rhizobiaceae bacterium]|nr:MAG: GTP-binding protein [Rhizobiaceae bacterium]
MRLTILGGFLGSGKTTWLRHQLHTGAYAHSVIMVNEAAETPVDDALLGRSERLVVLAGGCCCCTGRDRLVEELRRLCDERSRDGAAAARFDGIVLETSGLADPAAIVEAIRSDPVLIHHIVVAEIVVTVDALHGLAELRGEPLGRRQIEAATRLVVTKTDAAEPAGIARLLATLKTLNPSAPIEATARGSEIALPDLPPVEAEDLPDLAGAPSAPIFPIRIELGGDVDWTAFTVWLSALLHARGDDVMRAKGVVRTPAGRLLLQSVRKVVQRPEILPPQEDREDDTIVLIGRGYTEEQIRASLDYFVRAGRR